MQGRLTLVMGPPGGGKSTLLQLLAGLLAGRSVQVINYLHTFTLLDIFVGGQCQDAKAVLLHMEQWCKRWLLV